jgi:putative ABC transport system permease protein
LHQVVAGSLAIRRASLLLVASFAALALILSLVGVYGVLSYAVTQRTQEMGVRLALGAHPAALIRLVAAEGLRLTATGLLLGIAAGALAGKLVSKLLFDIRPLDPIAFAGAILLLLAVSLIASYIPARRASRIDPMVALRDE